LNNNRNNKIGADKDGNKLSPLDAAGELLQKDSVDII
jgi:hypothetical protein